MSARRHPRIPRGRVLTRLLLGHDLFRKPAATPRQARGRLFRDHALVPPDRAPAVRRQPVAPVEARWRARPLLRRLRLCGWGFAAVAVLADLGRIARGVALVRTLALLAQAIFLLAAPGLSGQV